MQTTDLQKFILANVADHKHSIVKLSMNKFNVSRTTVIRHINGLINTGRLIKSGKTKQTAYYLPNVINKKFYYSLKDQFDEFEIYKKDIQPCFNKANKNILHIVEYSITELLNNSYDHAFATKVSVYISHERDNYIIKLIDNGIGIFKKIANYLNINDRNIEESVLHLTKGKFTTDHANHTGEGIFFSSRASDIFIIEANNIRFTKNNLLKDWFLEHDNTIKNLGTCITMVINKKSNTDLTNIFIEYQDEDSLDFVKTEIIVELSKLGDERLISRSQAKRIIQGLEGFNHIILDFKRIETVGQGFVDEIFRVYKNKRPNIVVEYINANESVLFMLKRSIPSDNNRI